MLYTHGIINNSSVNKHQQHQLQHSTINHSPTTKPTAITRNMVVIELTFKPETQGHFSTPGKWFHRKSCVCPVLHFLSFHWSVILTQCSFIKVTQKEHFSSTHVFQFSQFLCFLFLALWLACCVFWFAISIVYFEHY